MTLAGLKGISTLFSCFFSQSNILYTSCDLTWNPSQFLTAASNRTLIENGKRPGYEDMYMIWCKDTYQGMFWSMTQIGSTMVTIGNTSCDFGNNHK